MTEHARTLFKAVLPTIDVEGSAYLNIHWSSIGRDGKKYWAGRACSGPNELTSTVDWALKGDKKDIYFCMSSQAKMEEKISGRGSKYKSALRHRDDVVYLRSLYADIDVKEGAYPTTKDALAAIGALVTSGSIPNPTAIVLSGSGGFHVHWALDRNMTRSEWQPLANALATFLTKKGIHFDGQCTVDSARILRVPGTLNHKTNPGKDTKLLQCGAQIPYDAMYEVLKDYMVKEPTLPATFQTKTGPRIADNDDLGGGMEEPKPPEITIEEVAHICPFIARTLGTGGKDNSEPLWFITAAISTFVIDGREALHDMSNKHAGYTTASTDERYDRAVKEQKERNIGWPKCATIEHYKAPECKNCPLFQQRKSPLNFVKPVQLDKPDPTLPNHYIRNSDGVILFRTIDDAGQQVTYPISPYPITNGWLSPSPWTFHFSTRLETGRKAAVEVPCEVITAKDSLAKYLGSCGFFCSDKEYKIVKEFFVNWIRRLQLSKDSVIASKPFGWSIVDGEIEGFAYGGRVWTIGEDKPAANPDPVLAYQYSPKGSIEPWMEVSRAVCQNPRPAAHALLAASFAGPLVKFTGYNGVMLNGYSTESGVGKTTASSLGQAMWGHPVSALQGLDDTTNSVIKKLGKIVNLPMYWDEFKNATQVKNFCNIVFTITKGQEKSRLNADSTLQVAGTWQTIMVSTTNASLIDSMAREVGSTNAGLYRLFEFVIPPSPVKIDGRASADVQRLLGRLADNYGHAGLVYAKFLGAHHKRIAAEVAKCQNDLHDEFVFQQDERFWHGVMTTTLMGAVYGNELKLTDINVDELKKFLASVLKQMRELIKESSSDLNADLSASSVLAEFLNQHRGQNTIITNRIWRTRGRPPKGAVSILNDASRINALRVHIAKDDKIIRFSSNYFSEWIHKFGHSRVAWTNKMKTDFGLKYVSGQLGGGTDIAASAAENLIELDASHPKLSQFVELL